MVNFFQKALEVFRGFFYERNSKFGDHITNQLNLFYILISGERFIDKTEILS